MTWGGPLCGDPGAVPVKATCAVPCPVLALGTSSTEDGGRLCSSTKQNQSWVSGKAMKTTSLASCFRHKTDSSNKHLLSVNTHNS